MLSLVLRRALGQYRLLAAVVALVTVAATLLGVCALLLGPTQDRAFARELQPTQSQDLDIDAFLVTLRNDDLVEVRETAADQLREVLGPLDPEVTVVETSPVRDLAGQGGSAVGYLSAGDGLAPRADLITGRWPESTSGPAETTVHEAAARQLGLALGDQVRLAGGSGTGGTYDPITLVVVGTFLPASDLGWESDPLTGAGVDPNYSDSAQNEAAYGPFVVDDAAFLASGSPVARLRITVRPDMAHADRESVTAAVERYDGAGDRLAADLADRVKFTRVTSRLPATLDSIEAQRAAGRSSVLVAVLLGAALSLAALLLAGRLVAAVRDEERVLLVALGASPRQQLTAAGFEAVLLAMVAAVLALPAAMLVHSWLTHTPGPEAAGLGQAPGVTGGLLLAVLGTTLVLAPALVLTALDTRTTSAATRRRWALAQTGADVTLLVAAVAVAALAWWQLRGQPATAAARGDVTLTLAPVVCVVAATLVVVHVVPMLLRAASRLALRSPALVLPLSAQQAARRPHPGTAMALVVAAVAAATFGLGFRSTWERSQVDQAAMRVGTDLTLTLPAPATPEDAAAVLAATKGSVTAAVTAQPLTLGRYLGDVGSPPVLVATDSRHAGDLLRGRLDGTTWGSIGAALSPATRVEGVPLPEVAAGDGRAVELTGQSPAGVTLSVTPTVVVQDDAGFRSAVSAAPVRLDGRPHPVRWQRSLGPGEVVAVHLEVDGVPGDDPGQETVVPVHVELRVPGVAASAGDPAWQVRSLGDQTPVRAVSVVVQPTSTGVVLRTSAQLDLSYLAYIPADLLATAFEAPTDIPVAVSQRLADQVGAEVGGEISATVGGAVLPLRVTAIVPTVPSAPGRIAVLADQDVLSRALISAGRVEPLVNGWWVADPPPPTVRALRALQLGDIATRDEATTQLAEGPLRVTVPAALVMLVVAGLALLLAGAGLLVSADQRRRSAEVARLRALGLTRRGARRLLLAEHVMFLGPLVLVGVLVGAAAAVLLGPGLIRSDVGAAPVPDAVVVWPWPAEAALVGGLLLGCVVIAAVVSALHVRRAGAAELRVGDS